jgi:hypothetical protein
VRIAILGTRGIPAAYGGFETLAWELSTRLAARGHEVTVYCRRGRTDESIALPGFALLAALPRSLDRPCHAEAEAIERTGAASWDPAWAWILEHRSARNQR